MTIGRFTHFDLFKVAGCFVKLMVIACKFSLFLSSVGLSGFVPLSTCFIKYIYAVHVVWLTVHLCYIQTHFSIIYTRSACAHCTSVCNIHGTFKLLMLNF